MHVNFDETGEKCDPLFLENIIFSEVENEQ